MTSFFMQARKPLIKEADSIKYSYASFMRRGRDRKRGGGSDIEEEQGKEGPLCKGATQQEGAALGEGCAGRAGRGRGPTSAKGRAARLGRAIPQIQRRGEG